MNRLWVRLTLAFSLVVLVAVSAIVLLMNRTADLEFRRYITHSDMQATGSGIEQLVAYYQAHGNSWEGIDSLLAAGVYVGGAAVGPPHGLPPEVVGAVAVPFGAVTAAGGPGALDILLASADGKIVYDSTGKTEGRRLRAAQRQSALAITAPDTGAAIGYLLLSLPRSDRLGTLEQHFLARIRAALLLGAILAAVLGLVVSAVLSRSLTAPLRRLAGAARAVGRGQLGQQVAVEGSAEVAEVGQAFNEMSAALEQAEAQRKNLVADVAHELRTPLTVLQGNLRAMLDGVYALDPAEISHLYDETRLLGRLVDDLRELALAEAGQLRLNLQTVNPARVICDTLDTLALAAEAQEVSLTADVPDALPAVAVDPDRVAQVLRNLLVNALRHTPAGGAVTATAAAVNGAIEVAVADTGEGIAEADLPHVFERFWRADPSRTRNARSAPGSGGRLSDSTGLGLSIAQSIVQLHGGRIWAESTPGEGAVFRFTLPLSPIKT